jgi:carbon monoxide dehydrogenase subunit G
MINLDYSTTINRSVKDVFAFASNPNNMSKWNSAVVSIEQVTPGSIGVGTKFKTIGETMGRRLEGELQVQTYEPESKCGFQLNAGPMQMNMTMLFEMVGTGTKLSLNIQGNPAGVFKLAEGVMAGQVKSLMEGNFAKLKSVLESGA